MIPCMHAIYGLVVFLLHVCTLTCFFYSLQLIHLRIVYPPPENSYIVYTRGPTPQESPGMLLLLYVPGTYFGAVSAVVVFTWQQLLLHRRMNTKNMQ